MVILYFNSLLSHGHFTYCFAALPLGHQTQTPFQEAKVLFRLFSFILQVEVANVYATHILCIPSNI